MFENRPRRNIERFDYKIYSGSGIKIGKGRKGILVMASSVAEEMKVVRRERFLVEYDLSLLYEVIDIKEGIKEVREIVEKYEELHITLRQELEGPRYEESYPEHNDKMQCVTDWIRKAKSAIKGGKGRKVFSRKARERDGVSGKREISPKS